MRTLACVRRSPIVRHITVRLVVSRFIHFGAACVPFRLTAHTDAPNADSLQCVSLSACDSTAGRWLRAARHAVLALNGGDSALKATVTMSTSWDYQSDRSYPPYLRAYNVESIYLDPSARMEGVVSGYESVVQGSTQRRLSDATGTYLRRDTTLMAAPRERNGAERTRMLEHINGAAAEGALAAFIPLRERRLSQRRKRGSAPDRACRDLIAEHFRQLVIQRDWAEPIEWQ